MTSDSLHRGLTKSTGTRTGDFSLGALGLHLIAPQAGVGALVGAGAVGAAGGLLGIALICMWAYSRRK